MGHSPTTKSIITMERVLMPRILLFLFFNIIVFIVFYEPLKDLFLLSSRKETYSHIVLIPFVSGYFMIADRRKIFHEVHSSVIPGMIFVLIGIILYMIGRTQHDIFNQNDYLSIMVFSALVLWSGGFIAFYGINTAKKARFPMLFLLFMVPIPTFILDTFIAYLQTWSAHVSYGMLRLLGIPMIREGFVFHLPELSVEVAEQCSGIRSSIALFITSVLAGHIFLRSGWQKGILTMSIFPLAIIKNGIRIVTLTLLGAYVDGAFLTNSILHKKGGILFFILALLLLSPIIWLLRKTEKVEIDGKSVVTIKR